MESVQRSNHYGRPTYQSRVTNRGIGGFSLLELILVIVVLSSILAIVVPKYSRSLDSTRLETTSEEVQSFFKLAQQYSRALNHEVSVSLNFTELRLSRFAIVDENGDNKGSLLEDYEIDKSIVVTLNSDIRKIMFYPRSPIVFMGDGNIPIDSPGTTIQFIDGSNSTADLVLQPGTGSGEILK
jgi:prepilin-type N-terminal cleavage/methylation domain-containing protein